MERQDRRRYFRINDMVGLSYRAVDSATIANGLVDGDNVHISSLKLLESINKELSEALNQLWQNNPATANVLGLLNRKIDFLSAEIGLDSAQEAIEHEQVAVNISACGMAFKCPDSFDKGQALEIHLLLKPGNTRLKLNGSVVGCERVLVAGQQSNFLRIDFTNIDTHVQEQLIQHLVRRQSSQLSEQRQD